MGKAPYFTRWSIEVFKKWNLNLESLNVQRTKLDLSIFNSVKSGSNKSWSQSCCSHPKIYVCSEMRQSSGLALTNPSKTDPANHDPDHPSTRILIPEPHSQSRNTPPFHHWHTTTHYNMSPASPDLDSQSSQNQLKIQNISMNGHEIDYDDALFAKCRIYPR